ncbi:MAG: DUF268 domain-containing protein [bacterium]|nr:DUF268 domain-containing protein [bacterium]
MKTPRRTLKKISFLKFIVIIFQTFKGQYGTFQKCRTLLIFFGDYRKYKNIKPNNNFTLKTEDLYPRIFDKTDITPLAPVYFFQNSWCAKKIFENKPERHFDIGSDAKMMGIISQFTPTTMIDIRPLPFSMQGLSFTKGDLLDLPFENGSIKSLSSICVIEHVGLGRYGDPLDSFGSEKSVKELSRVLAEGGNLYVSVPVDRDNITYFNAHRAFRRDYVLEIFSSLKLAEEMYIYGDKMTAQYDKSKGFGTGLYHFQK